VSDRGVVEYAAYVRVNRVLLERATAVATSKAGAKPVSWVSRVVA
jgi:hypothetical protein